MFRKNEPLDADGQPRLVRIGAALYDEDKEVSIVDLTIRPDGFTIPEDATKVHGITTDQAQRMGVPVKAALVVLWTLAEAASEIVGFGVDFDINMIRAEFARNKIDKTFPRPSMGMVDVMKLVTPICKIPNPDPRFADEYKWPKLSDATLAILKRPYRGAHDALHDMRATFAIYRELKQMGAVT